MFGIGRKRSDALNRRLRRGAILTLLAVGSQLGCTREFYRDWANQDAAEAVFEKSRDPRWRLDAFSIEPPAMSRFADPYDPEFPPAPPDDPTSEALSPVPQWPDHRLIVPVEGTGYIDMMEGWMREREAAIAKGEISSLIYATPGNGGRNGIPQPFTPPKPPGTPSPFAPGTGSPTSPPAGAEDLPSQPRHRHRRGRPPRGEPAGPPAGGGPTARTAPRKPGGNSGTAPKGSSPILLAKCALRGKEDQHPTSAAGFELQVLGDQPCQASQGWVGPASRPAAGPSPGPAAPTQAGPARSGHRFHQAAMSCRSVRSFPWTQRRVKIRCRKRPRRAVNRIPPGGPAGGIITPDQSAESSSVLIPKIPKFNVAAAVGLPRNANPYVVTLQQAFTLALINARIYQLQLENLYNAALAVALQRFQFEPQFYAGMSPRTSPRRPVSPA